MSSPKLKGEKKTRYNGAQRGWGVKRLRDVLIVVVLGSVVAWFVLGFIDKMHDASVNNSIVVRDAMLACLNDGMLCHFSSIESAQQYLDSPEHLAKVKARTEEEVWRKKAGEDLDIYANCVSKVKNQKQMDACNKERDKQLAARPAP
jgi:hypothetical protein